MKEISYKEYTISTDKSRLYVDYIHRYLAEASYWARNIPVDVVRTSIDNAFCVGAYRGDSQVGFGRLITDYATFAYLADIFVDERHRGRGLSKQMVRLALAQPFIAGLRRLMLSTRDAHGLYIQHGFSALKNPDAFMEIHRPDLYTKQQDNG